MHYELAKALEDAGFPQGGKGSFVAPPDKIVVRREDRVYRPTLSELVEACVAMSESGDFHLEHREGAYRSSACWRQSDPGTAEWFEGATPDIAVARLWLALARASSGDGS
jgi:hypothetical protein